MTDFSFVNITVEIPEYVPPAENEHFFVTGPSGDVFDFIQPATIVPGPDMSDPTFHDYDDPNARLVGWDKDSVFVRNADGSIADLLVETDPATAEWYMPPDDPAEVSGWMRVTFADYL